MNKQTMSGKVGVVGAGFVGATAAYALVLRGLCSELVLVDIDHERAEAEARDIAHAAPLLSGTRVSSGDFDALAGCAVIIVAAGANQKEGESRLDLLGRNAEIFAELIPRIGEAAPEAALLIATNPVDILTDLSAAYAPKEQNVLGSGTVLDSARFRHLMAVRAGVDATHVHGYVLGEHGDSEVVAWSSARVGSMRIASFMEARGLEWNDDIRAEIEHGTRAAAAAIIKGKKATYYGIGASLARIAEAILLGRRSVLTVSGPTPYGVAMSLPRIVGAGGIEDTLMPKLTPEESRQLEASAEALRKALGAVGQKV